MRRRLIALVLGIILALTSPLSAMAFFDTQGHWAGNTIHHLTARDIVHGKSTEIYAPNLPVTRAEFATLLTNGLDMREETRSLQNGSSSFSDINPGFWAKGSLELCFELQIMVPDSRGRCYPNRSITRAETAVMIAKALKLTRSEGLKFTDSDRIPTWAAEAVSAVCDAGIIKGFPDGTFMPQNNLTRAEAAVIIEKILEYRGDKYHGNGQLLSLDMDSRKARLSISGQNYTFDLADNFVLQPLSKAGYLQFPFPCYFDLDQGGDMVYCLQLETGESQPEFFTTSRAPVSPDSSRSGIDLWQLKIGTQDPLAAENKSMTEWANETDTRTVNPRMSSSLNSAEIKATDLRNLLGVDGNGVKVAVIDTGVDIGHQDLRQTPDGRLKVTDWVDLTDQGRVNLSPATVEAGWVQVPEVTFSLGDYISKSGLVRYGLLDPARLPVKLQSGSQKVLVVALDTVYAGIYDTVLIDLNGNGRLDDEKPLTSYVNSHEMASLITVDGKSFNFVISYISPAGNYVKLGFDAVGHGTKVAGILAGNGLLQGVAPGAQLVSIKVYDNFAGSDISRLKEAIRLAANMGVQVVNLSLGYTDLPEFERQQLETLINEMSASRGITFCISAGNIGPGLGSIASPADSQKAISVGGFLSPAIWNLNYGWQVSQPTLWHFSSVGPYAGGVAPLVVAPASATAADVKWRGDYVLEEGTSVAAPYVAGGVALLIQAARQEGINISPDLLRLAICRGADPIPDYSLSESGYGALNLMQSWQELKEKPLLPVSFEQGSGGRGLYTRSYLPGLTYLEMENIWGINQYLELSSTSPWIKISQPTLQVPGRSQRSVAVEYEMPIKPGLYSGMITGIDPVSKETRLESLQTVVVPYKLTSGSGASVSDELAAGMYRRYFFEVLEGNGQMRLNVTIPKESGRYQGRVRMHVMDPSGKVIHASGYAGSGYPETSAHEVLEYTQIDPTPGVWEVVVYSSVSLSQYDLTTSRFTVAANLASWVESEPEPPQDKYIITSVPSTIKTGVQNLTLHFWDKVTKLPARGRVLINNLLYELKNGKINLAITSQEQFPWLEIAW
jgi:subtilisin family serine protease